MENLRVLEGSEVFFRGLQHLYPRFKSGWHLLESPGKMNFQGLFSYKNVLAEDREDRLLEDRTASFPDAVRQIRKFFP